MTAAKHPCAERVYPDDRGPSYLCTRNGINQEPEGSNRWWCKQHTPSLIEARRVEAERIWREKRAAETAVLAEKHRRATAIAAIMDAFSTDTLVTAAGTDDPIGCLAEWGR